MRSSLKLSLLWGAFLCASVFPCAARADITGDTLDISYNFPDFGAAYADYGNFLANGMGHDLQGVISYAADGSRLYFFANGGLPAGYHKFGLAERVSFNGPLITDLSQSLAGYTVSLDPSSTAQGLDNVDPMLNGNTFSANFGGWQLTGGSSLIFDLNAPPPTATTPEPSSLVLLGSGILTTAQVMRRKLAKRPPQ